MSEHIGISPAEESWAVANDNETCLVVALNFKYFNMHILSGTISKHVITSGSLWHSKASHPPYPHLSSSASNPCNQLLSSHARVNVVKPLALQA
jgi:hypothetical protein